MAMVYSVPPAPPQTNTTGQASQGLSATKGRAQVASNITAAKNTIRLRRPRAGLAKRSATMPAGNMISTPPSPLTDTSMAAADAPRPSARPYSGRMDVTPVSKKPPTKPASMMMGWVTSACHRPCRPTRAVSVSRAAGTGGMNSDQPSPRAANAMTVHRAAGFCGPSQTMAAGPMMKVLLTMVWNSPT